MLDGLGTGVFLAGEWVVCITVGQMWIGRLAGGCPAASSFLCLAKERNQRKATPLCHPCGAGLDGARLPGRMCNSPWRAAHDAAHCGARTVLAVFPRQSAAVEVAQRGIKPSVCLSPSAAAPMAGPKTGRSGADV